MQHSPVDVQRAIADVEFPATPDELAASAEQRGANETLCTTLRSLPDEQYNDVDSVLNTIDDQVE